MAEYQQGLTPGEALALAERNLSHPDLTAAECNVLALQLGAHRETADLASDLFTLARILAERDQHPAREWQAAWGAGLAAVRSAIEEREGVVHAA